jgi:ribosomal protein L21E
MFIIKFSNDERARVTMELDSHFTKEMPGKVWQGNDGAIIEIRPPEQLSLVTGKPPSADGFLVVISDAVP